MVGHIGAVHFELYFFLFFFFAIFRKDMDEGTVQEIKEKRLVPSEIYPKS